MGPYERIAASAPVNAQAARQLGGGEHWEPSVKLQDYFTERPPLKAIDKGCLKIPDFIDFTGSTYGRLTVLGLMNKTNGEKTASWVCRCQCGGYCTRRTKSLRVAMRGGNSFVDRCGRCQYIADLRSGWSPKPKTPTSQKDAEA